MSKVFKFLDVAMYKKGISKKGMAKALNISERTLRKKINGESPFTWPEVQKIKNYYFPEFEIKDLFIEETDKDNKAS